MSIGYLLIPTLFVHVQVLFALLVYTACNVSPEVRLSSRLFFLFKQVPWSRRWRCAWWMASSRPYEILL